MANPRQPRVHVRRSVWLGALSARLTRAPFNPFEDASQRHARHTLMMSGLMMMGLASLWVPIYALLMHGLGLLEMALFVLCGWGVRALTLRGQVRAASCLLFASCTVLLTLACLLLDVPMPHSPRTTHLFFLALVASVPLLLRRETQWVRLGVMGTILLIFLLFAATDISVHSRYALPPAIKRACAWIDSIGAFVALLSGIALSQARHQKRAELLSELHAAVRREQFVQHLQATVDGQRRIQGAEALIRWLHPRRGLIPADEFMALAQSSGLVLPIGQWALAACCDLLARWQADPCLWHLSLTVNVSADQLRHADFVPQLLEALQTSQAPASQLVLKLGETTRAKDVTRAARTMHELAEHGLRFALDDIGSRHSSLSHLLALPVARLKIDRDFVHALHLSPRAAAIVRAMLDLGRSMDRPVLAQGVESEEQLARLREMGCQHFHGPLFGAPQPVANFEARLCNHRVARKLP